MARRTPRTDISLWDYAKLRQELCSRPRRVLRYFAQCQVWTLGELAMYREIKISQPEVAARIATVAARMGIADECDSDIQGIEPAGESVQ